MEGRLPSADPLIEEWPAGKTIVRVYPRARGPRGFNPTDSPGRFRPVRRRGRVVPTMYGGEDEETAIAEVLLRGMGGRAGRRRLYRLELWGMEIAALVPRRALRLARLHGLGLRRLGLTRADVIDTEESAYPETARLAQWLFDHELAPDGVVWTSRQNDSAKAVMLFGGRVSSRDLSLDAGPYSLEIGEGLELVQRVCVDAGVDLDA